MRWLRSVGKEVLRVLEYIQSPKMTSGTDAHVSQFILDIDGRRNSIQQGDMDVTWVL
jgi:hypothetical protein